MMAVLYTNNAISTLAASITNTATSFSVTSGHGARFPAPGGSDFFFATLTNSAGNIEIVKVTARSADTFTVVRGQDGTSGLAWSAGAAVELRITKGLLDQIKTDIWAGNAATATKLASASTMSLGGDLSGSASFDGSKNITITATVSDDSHAHSISTITGLQTALDGKQAADADLTAIAGLVGTSGFLKKTAANTWTLDTTGYTTNTGTVTSVGGTGGYGGLTLSGTVTSSGNLTLGGTPTGTWPISISGSAASATTASTANALNTSNNYQVNSLGVGTAGSGTAGEIRATNNITAYYSSDIRYKENVHDIPNAALTACAIGGKLFDWTEAYIEEHGGEDGYFVRKQDFGVIAQDVQQWFPRAVRTRPDGSLAVDYEKLCALALAAIREQQAQLQLLETKVNDLMGA